MPYKPKPEWQLWEEEVAGRIGGDLVKASGRLTGYKGDVKTSGLLVDCKHTGTRRYTLSSKMWKSASDWAMNEMRAPMIAVKLAGCGLEVGIMRHRDFRDMWAAASHSELYATFDKGIRMSVGISDKTPLPITANMVVGSWCEEIVAMRLDRMLKLVGIHED